MAARIRYTIEVLQYERPAARCSIADAAAAGLARRLAESAVQNAGPPPSAGGQGGGARRRGAMRDSSQL